MRAVIFFLSSFGCLLWLVSLAQAETVSKATQLLGKPLAVEQSYGATSTNLGLTSTTQAKILGQERTLMETSIEALPSNSSGPDAAPVTATDANSAASGVGIAKTDLYIGGTRVWAGDLKYDKGSFVYSGGVAPTQMPFPLFAYPVGPLMIRVDAGISFEGTTNAALTPGLSYPLTDSSLDATLEADLSAAAYIEGYASLWLVRGGVGGALDLVEGATGVTGHLYVNGMQPALTGFGKIIVLAGDVYAFIDTKLFFGKWNRILKKDFFKWNGWCYSFGDSACGS